MKMTKAHFEMLENDCLSVIKSRGLALDDIGTKSDAWGIYWKVVADRCYDDGKDLFKQTPRALPYIGREKWDKRTYAYLNDSHIQTALKRIFGMAWYR